MRAKGNIWNFRKESALADSFHIGDFAWCAQSYYSFIRSYRGLPGEMENGKRRNRGMDLGRVGAGWLL